MNIKEQRLLDPANLPKSLWEASPEMLFISPELAKAYKTLIIRHGLEALSQSRDSKNPPTGGFSQEETDKHFAQAFDGSAARAQLAVLDPKQEVPRASNAFIKQLSGNEVCITDAPCGAGAAAIAFFGTIAELRYRKVLPREPLTVHLIGAEISEPARIYAVSLLKEMTPFLESQAVFVNSEYFKWDVTDKLSNTNLIKKMTRASSDNVKRLLIVANFSDFLIKRKKWEDAKPQLEELFRHSSGPSSIVIWIEPQVNTAITSGGLFSKIILWASSKLKKFCNISVDEGGSDPFQLSGCQFTSPLDDTKTHTVRLSVMRLDLEHNI